MVLLASCLGHATQACAGVGAESSISVPVQERLDAIVSTVDSGRAFVRPSGTEDIVRIYAGECGL